MLTLGPSRSAKDPGPRSPWIRRLRNPPEHPGRKRSPRVSLPLDHPASSLYCASRFKEGTACPLKAFQRMLGLMAAALPVLQLDMLHMRPIQFWLKQRVPSAAWRHGRHRVTVTRACVSGLASWRDSFWLKRGVSRNNVSSEEWTLHPLAVQRIWEVFGRARVDLFASEDNSHCPIFFTKSTDAQPSALCFSPSRSATASTQASQGTTAQADPNSAPLEEPTVGFWVIPAAESSPLVNPLETGPPLSSERHDMASTARVMGPACVAARREPFVLPERVLNTMAEARAPSTRCLYALKWSIFSAWCQDRDLDPVTFDVSVVLSFLQEMLDKKRTSSTIKVCAAAIAASMPLLLADQWAEIVG